jgi:hypothetical protein
MEIVFCSSDNNEAEFDEYFGEMPWVALPYSERDTQAKLSTKYEVGGIPSLVIVDAGSGELCTCDGRDGVSKGAAGLASFPWRQPSPADAQPEPHGHGHGSAASPAESSHHHGHGHDAEGNCVSDGHGHGHGHGHEPDSEPGSGTDLALGEEVELLKDPVALRSVFARFMRLRVFGGGDDEGADEGEAAGAELEGDGSGTSPTGDMEAMMGELEEAEGLDIEAMTAELASSGVGVIVEVYEPDRSLTLRLVESGELLECPFEAVARKTGNFDKGFEWTRAEYTIGQTVQLVAEPEAFRDAFSRFEGDGDENDWSEEKQAYLGAIAKVAAVYDDKTMSLKFNDAVELDFPFEVIDLGVTKQLGAAITVVKDFQLIYCGPSGRVVI